MKVLRVYHSGRDGGHRARERALSDAGVQVTLVVPGAWPGADTKTRFSNEPFSIVELSTTRSGDVNRHAYTDVARIRGLISELDPDVIDIHEEPFSVTANQWLEAVPRDLAVVLYTAQNIDKRYPPPFMTYEHRSHRRAAALYPCSRQAASVARGKGFSGLIDVIPLGFDSTLFHAGNQSLDDDELVMALVGRLVPEKGVGDAIHVLAEVNRERRARLLVIGSGPEEQRARRLASSLNVDDRVEFMRWQPASALAEVYRRANIVLVPSVPTQTWTEQFGRVIIEAQASGAVVAGYATGSIPEVAGDAALLSPTRDVASLAGQLIRLVGDAARYQQLRDRGVAVSASRTWARVAMRQAELYARVAERRAPRLELPRSPRSRRKTARQEFGSTAPSAVGMRPFALPVLRAGGPGASALAAFIDTAAELLARVGLSR
jgi:glycosyltransferase involved in cell wall biosynthesis